MPLRKHRRHHKKHRVVRRRVVRRRVVRRRARGDVWLRDSSKLWVDVNAVGTFNYLTDNRENFNIQVQFGKLGKGSVLRGVAVSFRGKKL